MAAISDPEATGFVNEQLRPAADRMAQAYYFLKTVLDHWNFDHLAAKIPPGSSALIDQSAQDPRHQPTADNCYGMIIQAQAFVDTMEANNKANLAAVLLLAVNSNP